MPADFSPPFPTLAEAAASRPSPEQMQRINFYGSLCQAPDCSHGVGCSYPAAPWGSWEERLVEMPGLQADSQSRNGQDKALR